MGGHDRNLVFDRPPAEDDADPRSGSHMGRVYGLCSAPMGDLKDRATTDEKELLASFMDTQREAMLAIADGLSDQDLRKRLVPSDTTILGMIKHLAYVERWWFQDIFEGRDCTYPWTDDDPDADFRIEQEETTAGILDVYRAECEVSRSIFESHDLFDVSVSTERPRCTLKWIVLHMIEETARHAGQADILREQIDGKTGLGP
ncbi:MAG: DUF664 domain-containing protein [Actinobacteria bacterium]|nr:DUF664 domain-containing protein [Actinomycetota bacterium]